MRDILYIDLISTIYINLQTIHYSLLNNQQPHLLTSENLISINNQTNNCSPLKKIQK
jgi:hypothetical protein